MFSKTQFPYFKKLTSSDKDAIQTITRAFKPYSDYNFASLLYYNLKNDSSWSHLNNNLVFLMRAYNTQENVATFIGKNNVEKNLTEYLSFLNQNHSITTVSYVPQETIDVLEHSSVLTYREDPNNHDYILHIPDYIHLSGKTFASKRKKKKHFHSQYPTVTFGTFQLTDPQSQQEIHSLFNTWTQSKKYDGSDWSNEYDALKNFLSYHTLFDVKAFGAWDTHGMIGFSIVELDSDQYVQNHYFKTLLSYKGLYEAFDSYICTQLNDLGYRYLNIMQDMGIPGLKKAKQLCRPVHFLKKYKVGLRNSVDL